MPRFCYNISHAFDSCAECPELSSCPTIQDFFKKGYKYSRYQPSTEFIRDNGSDAFLRAASAWAGAYGKLP